MSKHSCPVCGASVMEGSAMCVTCKSGLRWQAGQPVAAMKGRNASLLNLSFLAVLLLSAVAFSILLILR